MQEKEKKEDREALQNNHTPPLSKLKLDPMCDVCNDVEQYPACQACCEHEFDMDEGYTCLNCGEQGDVGRLIDRAMDYGED